MSKRNEVLENMGRPDIGRWVSTGFVVIAVFLVLFGAWAGLVPLDAATVARGKIALGTERQLVQHLEGGIVRQINVQEHSQVSRGDLLVRFDDTRARAALDLVTNQLVAAQAKVARLRAEQQRLDAIQWPESFDGDANAGPVMQEETEIFLQRVSEHLGKLDLIDNKLTKIEKAIVGTESQRVSAATQLSIIGREVKQYRESVDKGLISIKKLNELEREMHALDERLRSLDTRIASGQHEIEETRLQRISQETNYANEVAELLHAARLELSDLEQKAKAASDVLARTEVFAPDDGVVLNLNAHTLGGVIGSGEPIMEIVPADASYRVIARVKPGDIDAVWTGAPARVRLTAFKQRITPTLEGRLESLFGDALLDQANGESYFEAVVVIEPTEFDKNPGLQLHAGMPADVLILTEPRTLIDYLFQPVFESFSYAFRES